MGASFVSFSPKKKVSHRQERVNSLSCAAMLRRRRRHSLFLCHGTLFPFAAQKNVPAHFFVFDKKAPKWSGLSTGQYEFMVFV